MRIIQWLIEWYTSLLAKPLRRVEKPAPEPGAVESPLDTRDSLYAVPIPFEPEKPAKPVKHFLAAPVVIKNQGRANSCVSHAVCTALEYLEVAPPEGFSELYHYYYGRIASGTFPRNDGIIIRDGLKALKNMGVCSEKLHPYTDSFPAANKQPNALARMAARNTVIKEYNRVWDQKSVKECVLQDKPVLAGMWFTALDTTITYRGEFTYHQNPHESPQLFRHMVVIDGYDDERSNANGTVGAFRYVNSYGTTWGDEGRGWLPYSSYTDRVFETWTLTVAKP